MGISCSASLRHPPSAAPELVSAGHALSQTRRLAAMLAADVAGYSRLMGADEEGTLDQIAGGQVRS
jgi:class 3 adenylate cyclase